MSPCPIKKAYNNSSFMNHSTFGLPSAFANADAFRITRVQLWISRSYTRFAKSKAKGYACSPRSTTTQSNQL